MVCEAIRLYELKKKVAKDLESILPRESLLKARRDPHARRNRFLGPYHNKTKTYGVIRFH